MNDSAYKKYLKYKKKYLSLKKSINQMSEKIVFNYYFIHMTSLDNLINILQDGIIYPNKNLPKKNRILSGSEQDFVYANMFIDDYDIYKTSHGPALLLHPKILYENGFYFNETWVGAVINNHKYTAADGHTSRDENDNIKVISKNSLHIKSTDIPVQINHKLNKIRQFLINPTLPKVFAGITTHEVLFDHPIKLDNNLLAIVGLDQKYLEKIKTIISDKPYNDVIFWNESTFPKLDDINFK
ncbi:hypothetical protein QJ854_gp967 [Moumouvirus goulette]|uniref:Uncharacterized protein n=1 Tax=Moumouvirus goulette TaxID=1247379 RepID=M1NLD1_9VIRU|nr:hypothetical protein QJ854_gp967 [Moumouvirus goulette]AGF84815.1 hypothetical protein glt_00005 [Moumouvirus goulette]